LKIGAMLRARSIGGDWFARHPEWWVVAISAAAWLALAVPARHSVLLPLCAAASSNLISTSFSALSAAGVSSRLAGDFFHWVLMIAAMMPSLVILPIRHVAFRSFRDRRHRAMAEFLAGYMMVWIVAGTIVLPVLIAPEALGASEFPFIVAIGYSIAVAWQLTPFKRRALQQCHRMVPLAPEGWPADAACIRFGLGSAGRCIASCWALMAVMMLTSPGLAAMACIQAVMIRERYQRQPRRRTSASVLLLCAAFLLDLPSSLV
jgi:predicted metal-binding membrane protein